MYPPVCPYSHVSAHPSTYLCYDIIDWPYERGNGAVTNTCVCLYGQVVEANRNRRDGHANARQAALDAPQRLRVSALIGLGHDPVQQLRRKRLGQARRIMDRIVIAFFIGECEFTREFVA